MALRPGQRVRLRDADAEFEMRLRSVPASYCPSCFIRLPLSGEPNCDCDHGPVRITRAPQPPMGTHGHPQGNQAEIDRSNGGEQ